jgi:hypothetical protein
MVRGMRPVTFDKALALKARGAVLLSILFE